MRTLRPGLLPIIFLVVIIAWALFAVAMLTGTLIAAQKIDNRVVAINKVYPEVNRNLDSIPLALETGRIADEISKAVKPIGPQFTQVVDVVGTIDTSVKGIGGSVGTINDSVHSINAGVKTIGVTVGKIDTGLSAVNDEVQSIHHSAKGIESSFDGILEHVESIDGEVAGINHRAEKVIDVARDIDENLKKTLAVALQINQNAAAIANSPVVQLNSVAALLALINTLVGVVPCAPTCTVPDLGLSAPVVPVALPQLAAVSPAPQELVAGVPQQPALNAASQSPLPESVPLPSDGLSLTPLGDLAGPLG